MIENPTVGMAEIINGKLNIIDGSDLQEGPWLYKGKDVSLNIDGNSVRDKVRVNSESNIEIIFPASEAKRELNINIEQDKMSVSISITYIPEIIYTLEDFPKGKLVTLNAKVASEKWPPLFTKEEIISKLKSKGVVYGLDMNAINYALSQKQVENHIIARGKAPIEPVDDILKINFAHNENEKFKIDNYGNVDFKSIGNVVSVKEGEVIAQRIPGKNGTIGIDVFAKPVQPRKRVVKDMLVKNGCKFKDKDTIVSTVEGHPEVKGCVFQVSNVHEVLRDVDITTGNVNFIGDVMVNNDICEGMSVKSGNKLVVNGNITRGDAWSEGDMIIKGSSISSNIKVKSELAELKDYGENLIEVMKYFNNIYEGVVTIKNSAAYKENITDGNLIKLVIESKFFKFHTAVKQLIDVMVKNNEENNDLYRILKIKYITRNYTLINSMEELKYVALLIEDKLNLINSLKDIKANALLGYVQDCEIYSSGSVYIEGKGVYKSNISAEEGIYFTAKGMSDLRGGRLYAKKEIKAKIVGAPSGVTTELQVDKDGHIYCEIAHLNTVFKVGNMVQVLDESCKNVHVYIDKNRDLVIDKFKM